MDFTERTKLLQRFVADSHQKQMLGLAIGWDAPALCEMAVPIGVDWLLIDMEHTELANTSVLPVLRAADATGLPYFVKLPTWNASLACDVLDFGAYGVQVGFVNTAQQLRDMLSEIRFPPDGSRGWCSIARSAQYTNYLLSGQMEVRANFLKFSNEQALIIPTIETVEAVNNIDELLQVEDCPIWHIGRNDLGLALLGWDAPFDQDFHDEVAKVTVALERKIHAAGKILSMPFTLTGRKGIVDGLHAFNVDHPYTIDGNCFAYGLREAKAGIDELRTRKR